MTDTRVVVALADRDVLEQYVAVIPEGYGVETATTLREACALLSGARVAFVDRALFADGASPAAWLDAVDPDCRVALVSARPLTFDPIRAGFDAVVERPRDADAIREAFVRLLRLARYDDLIRDYASRAAEGSDVEGVRRALDALVAEFDERAYKAAFREPGEMLVGKGSATPPAGRRAP